MRGSEVRRKAMGKICGFVFRGEGIVKKQVVLALTALTAASEAAAQVRIEEIIVTAKNRDERLQDVPLSISAFNSETLQRNQILDVRDLQRITPALSVYSFTGRADPSGLSLRGVAPNTSDERYQGVSFFLDGIALSGQLSSIDLASLERVEVLKGPQNATFGRATYSGAISYISRDPDGDEVTGIARLRGASSKAARGPDFYAGFYLSAPVVSDRVWLAVQGSGLKNAAMYRDQNDGSKVGQEKSVGGAATLLFRPSDNLKIKARASYDWDRDTAPGTYVLHPREFLAAGVPTIRLTRAPNVLWPTRVPDPVPGLAIDGGRNSNIYQPGGGNTRDRIFGSLVATYDLNGTELSYRGGYFYSDDEKVFQLAKRAIRPGQDLVFGPLVTSGAVTIQPTAAAAVTSGREVFKNHSHQLLAVSPADEDLRWRLGAYYFSERDLNWVSTALTAANPVGRTRATETIENLAAFGGFDYDVAEAFTLSAEARLAQEKITWGTCTICMQVTTKDTTVKRTDLLPRLTGTYRITPDNLVYAMYAKGTKGGRFSFFTVSGTTGLNFAEPEKLDNYEIGTKNTFWDGRAVVNLSAYVAKVTQQQLVTSQQVLGANGAIVNINTAQNVGTSRVPGFELEGQVNVTEALNVTAGVGYAGQRFTNKAPILVAANTSVLFPGTVAGDPIVIDGKQQASVPRWNGSIGFDYTVPSVFGDYELLLHADANYRGKFYADLANIAVVPSSWKINTRIALSEGPTELAFFVRNLTNNRRTLGSGLAGNSSTCTFIERDTATYGANQQCVFVALARPRQIGLEARIDF